MHEVINKSDIFVYYNTAEEDLRHRSSWIVKKIGDEKQLIVFLAEGFYKALCGWDEYTDEPIYRLANRRFGYVYYDGYNRSIDVHTYYDDALLFHREHLKGRPQPKRKYVFRRDLRRKYSFRNGNVECVRKRRGGPCVKARHIRQAKSVYLDPEQKPFNRGSISDYPEGWWDDWNRCVERNWKSQRRTRHQWKGSE